MAAKLTARGRVTVPRKVREVLQLSPGDCVEFGVNSNGEIVVRKAPAPTRRAGPRTRLAQRRTTALMRRRAAELDALLRGLD
jgi:AbrB family looped-hinge helix DNA binding protein